jgi:hypothetical protein
VADRVDGVCDQFREQAPDLVEHQGNRRLVAVGVVVGCAGRR